MTVALDTIGNPAASGATLKRRSRLNSIALAVSAVLTLLFLALPILIVVPMSFSSAGTLQFPPPGFSLRWYESFFSDPQWVASALNSLAIGAIASTISLVFGTCAAYALVRGSFFSRKALEANFMAPMVLPPVIIAVSLYIFYAKLGILGTYFGIIMAHVVLTAPYVVLLMSLAIRAFDVRIEQIAMTLGASRLEMMVRILLPNILPNAAAAWLFAFVISFDEVVVTLFVSGSHLTVPKRMFNQLVLQINPTITAIATILIFLSLVSVALALWLTRGTGLVAKRLS